MSEVLKQYKPNKHKLFVMSCMAILLFCHTSCQDGAEEFLKPSVELEKECQELNLQRLVQQARGGYADACMALAGTLLKEGRHAIV